MAGDLWDRGIALCYPVTPRPPFPEAVGTHTLLVFFIVTPLPELPCDLYEYINKGNGISAVTHRHTNSSA
jgi:hypothetical protein